MRPAAMARAVATSRRKAGEDTWSGLGFGFGFEFGLRLGPGLGRGLKMRVGHQPADGRGGEEHERPFGKGDGAHARVTRRRHDRIRCPLVRLGVGLGLGLGVEMGFGLGLGLGPG